MLGRRCKRQVLAWERVELARVMPASAANIRSQRNREMIRAAAVTARESACTMHAGAGTSSEATAAALGEAEEGQRDVATDVLRILTRGRYAAKMRSRKSVQYSSVLGKTGLDFCLQSRVMLRAAAAVQGDL